MSKLKAFIICAVSISFIIRLLFFDSYILGYSLGYISGFFVKTYLWIPLVIILALFPFRKRIYSLIK